MIHVNGQKLTTIGGLTTRSQAVLSMIRGGQKWLSWCIADQPATNIHAVSENQLLKIIQKGLNGDEYIRFNTFRAGIDKILSLPDADTEQLAAIQLSANDNEANLAVLLRQNNMLSYGDIARAADLMPQVVQTRPDLFQAISFEDMLTLADFVRSQQQVSADIQTRSAAFALASAATISDFVNLSLFFQYALQNSVDQNLAPQAQNSEIQALYTQFDSVIQPYLFTTSVDMTTDPRGLAQLIPNLARATSFIGYTTATSAILNLIRNISLSDSENTGLPPAIDTYLVAVKNLVSFTPATGHVLSQDGTGASLKFQSGPSLANVGVDRDGAVFLLPDTKIATN